MITTSEINKNTTIFTFAQNGQDASLIIGHDYTRLFIEGMKFFGAKIKIGEIVSKEVDFENRHPARTYFTFHEQKDTKALILMLENIKNTPIPNSRLGAFGFYADQNCKKVQMVGSNYNNRIQLALLFTPDDPQLFSISKNLELNNIDFPNYVFTFTSPKSIDTLITVLKRISIIISESQNGFALAC